MAVARAAGGLLAAALAAVRPLAALAATLVAAALTATGR